MELGELLGYQTQTFYVYYIIQNNDKISNLITSKKIINPSHHIMLLFEFEACIEKGYEHPIGVCLIHKQNPKRTILDFDFENKNKADFYIKYFKDKLND
jgi:hypothetical protein